MNPLHSEKEFILQCIKALVFREDLCVEESGFPEALDWDWIVRTSYDHRLLGFIAFILDKGNLLKQLDHEVQVKLNAGLRESQLNNQLRQKQFQEVNAILSTNSIPVIPLKGLALTDLIYHDVPFREMNDIDILVKQSDVKESFRLLAEAGFCLLETYQSKNRWHQRIYAETDSLWDGRILGRLAVVRDELLLDVHFNPTYRVEEKNIDLNVAGIWQRALPCPELGSNVFTLDPKDLLRHLLIHTVDFFKPHLIQVLDTACVIRKYNFSGSDISDQISVAPHSPTSALTALVNAIQELMNIKQGRVDFSRETTEVFERFFSRPLIPDETEQALETEDSIFGIEMFRNIKSRRKRLIFIAGYLLPNPDYYRQKGAKFPYLIHWWELISKVWRLGRSRFSKQGF